MSYPKYKLSYFDGRGLAEMSRFIFAYADIPYEDHRISKLTWPLIKRTMPYRSVPVLEVDGVVHGQSLAIARFLAKKYKLAGTDDREEAYVDAIVEHQKDIWNGNIDWWMHEKDPAKQKELRDKYVNEKMTDHLDVLDYHLKNDGDGKLFCKSGVTFADFAVAIILDTLEQYIPGSLDKYPALVEHGKTVHSLPGIKEWVAKRPQSPA